MKVEWVEAMPTEKGHNSSLGLSLFAMNYEANSFRHTNAKGKIVAKP